MYIRDVHAERDVAILHEFIRQFPLGLFTTAIPHPDHATLQTTPIPFLIDEPKGDGATEPKSGSTPNFGRLRGHMARANPQSKAMIASVSRPTKSTPSNSLDDSDELAEDVLIIFQAPTHSYVTPAFYITTKPTSGKVVPTWDYAAVQVYGRARIYHANNTTTRNFLQRQVEDLASHGEPTVGASWKVGDAPTSYIELKKGGIVGVEIEITKIEGRFKLSQEEKDGDWVGIVKGFRGLGTVEGTKMAEMIEARGTERDADLIDSLDQKTSEEKTCPVGRAGRGSLISRVAGV